MASTAVTNECARLLQQTLVVADDFVVVARSTTDVAAVGRARFDALHVGIVQDPALESLNATHTLGPRRFRHLLRQPPAHTVWNNDVWLKEFWQVFVGCKELISPLAIRVVVGTAVVHSPL